MGLQGDLTVSPFGRFGQQLDAIGANLSKFVVVDNIGLSFEAPAGYYFVCVVVHC